MSGLTPAKRKFLEWARDNSPFSGWTVSRATFKRCEEAGWIERCGREPGAFGLTRYTITASGLTALKDQG